MTESEWQKSGDRILSFEHNRGWSSSRKQRLFAVACCRRIEHLLSENVWGDGLEIAERYADRGSKRDELRNIGARLLTGASFYETYRHACYWLSGTAVRWACETHRRKYAAMAAVNARAAVGYAALPPEEAFAPAATSPHRGHWAVAEGAESVAQLAVLYELCGDPFRPITFSPEWRTDTAVALATQMYASRDFSAMPILADALQDAGCDNDDILAHCRNEGVHVRGCWVVDLVLGKE